MPRILTLTEAAVELRILEWLADWLKNHPVDTAGVPFAAMEPNIRRAEIARARAKPTESLDARDLYLRAQANIYLITRTSLEEAANQLNRALAIDPDYALARAHLARIYQFRNLHGWVSREILRPQLLWLSMQVASDDNDPRRFVARDTYSARLESMNAHWRL